MGWFKGPDVNETICPEDDMVCAYKDMDGSLHESPVSRDKRNQQIRSAQLTSQITDLLLAEHQCIPELNRSIYLSGNNEIRYRASKRDAMMNGKMHPEQVAKMLIKNWAFIKMHVEEMMKHEDR